MFFCDYIKACGKHLYIRLRSYIILSGTSSKGISWVTSDTVIKVNHTARNKSKYHSSIKVSSLHRNDPEDICRIRCFFGRL